MLAESRAAGACCSGDLGHSSGDACRPEGIDGETWRVWPDRIVLGPTPGKELRRWLATRPPSTRMTGHRAFEIRRKVDRASVDGLLLFGRQVERFVGGAASASGTRWLIRPSVPPPPDP